MIFGIALIVMGLILRFYCLRYLRTDFRTELRMPHRFRFGGPYRYIRHPSYLGSLMVLGGLLILDVRIAFFYLAYVFYLARATDEEKILNEDETYSKYRKVTGMFIPRCWR